MSEQDHEKNLASQLAMTPQTVQQLREYDVTEDKSLKLEYFFTQILLRKPPHLIRSCRNWVMNQSLAKQRAMINYK